MKVKLKLSGRIYIVYKEATNTAGVKYYYCNLEKDGKPWGATKQFTADQLEFL